MNFDKYAVETTAWLATSLYFATLLVHYLLIDPDRRTKWSRRFWTAGLVAYLLHVVAAFQFVHHWSHAEATASTAARTAELTGIATGVGIYFNYLFTAVWTADVVWCRFAPRSYAVRSIAISAGIQGFMAFMFFNAVVVFGYGPVRWIGLAATVFLICVILRRRIIQGRGLRT